MYSRCGQVAQGGDKRMIGKLWRRLFGRRVFISYREREQKDDRVARLIADGLQRHGMYTLLEDQKKTFTGDYSEHLYRLLAGAEAVVSIWSPESQDSQWLFFEGLTARIQKKLHLVKLPGANLHVTFADYDAFDATDILDDSTRDKTIAKLAARIRNTAPGAKVYRGAPGIFDALRRMAATAFALLVAILSFVVLADNARKAACSHDQLRDICASAGWSATRQGS